MVLADPAFRARQGARLREVFADPEHRRRRAASTRARHVARSADPAYVEALRESGRQLRKRYDASPDAQARNLAARGRAARTRYDRVFAWCPDPDLRELYRHLRRSKAFTAAEARAVVEGELARRAALPPRPETFEEQLARVAAGAPIAMKLRLDVAEPIRTLGGVASGML